MAADTPLTGPIPKRSEERRRRNKDETGLELERVDIAQLASMEIEIPVADPDWDPIAIQLWDALKRSGGSIYLEPSDWAVAYLLCESISRDLSDQVVGITEHGEVIKEKIPLKGASLNSYLKGFASLMMLEGDRRRLRVELNREKNLEDAAKNDGVTSISQHRAAKFRKQSG